MENLHSISQGAANAISFYSGKINTPQNFYIVGTNDGVKNVLQNVGILGSLNVMDSYDASKVGIS
jgi:hypothetical protein